MTLNVSHNGLSSKWYLKQLSVAYLLSDVLATSLLYVKPGFQPYAKHASDATQATKASNGRNANTTYATYHVTNSSHVIGNFLRCLRQIRTMFYFSGKACFGLCVACVACVRLETGLNSVVLTESDWRCVRTVPSAAVMGARRIFLGGGKFRDAKKLTTCFSRHPQNTGLHCNY